MFAILFMIQYSYDQSIYKILAILFEAEWALTHWGQYKMAAILQTIFANAFS